MIIAEFGDGLGNEMFVYAAARNLADYHKVPLKLDISYFDTWPKKKDGGHWDFELGKLNITAPIASKEEVRKYLYKTKSRHLNYIFRKFKIGDKKVAYFPSNGKMEDFYKIPADTYLRGYLGKEKFFDRIRGIILKEFSLKDEYKKSIQEFIDKVSKENSVSLHVRRGDLLKKNRLVLDLRYYKKAIEIIKNKVKNPKIYVFSDDYKWCEENLKDLGAKLNISGIRGGHYVLEAMRSCKHNILANSALSWWAGYLNNNPNRVVIAPARFTHFKDAKVDDDTLPENWIKVDF